MIKIATEIHWLDRRFSLPIERIKLTEQLGFDAIFTAEGSGSDALTPLAYVAAITSKIKLGTHIAAISARPPTVLAQAFQTIDAMAGGDRIIVGLGNSQPKWVEGWHGRPWGKPVRRMHDYVNVLKQVFGGDGPIDIDGNEIETSELTWEHVRARLRNPVRMQSSEISIPYAGEGAQGVEPWVSLLGSGKVPPIILAAIGPQVITLTAEIADGWFPMGFVPGMMKSYEPLLKAGFEKAGNGKGFHNFDIWAIVDLLVINDVKAGLNMFREYIVEYAKTMRPQMEQMGYSGLSERVAELVAAGHHDEARAAVPDSYVDDLFLIGPRERIAQRLKAWIESGATGLIFRYGPQVKFGANKIQEDLGIYETIAQVTRRLS